MRARSVLVVIALVGLSLGTSAPQADAAFHNMKIREVHAGSLVDPNADFVELQMYTSGQQVVGGHFLEFYDAAGTMTKCTIPTNVANGTNQAHILFATTQAQAAFGIADFTLPSALIAPSGGAICFERVDCVTWGSFSGNVTDDKGLVTSPEPAIPQGQSIHRDLGADGMLQASDDTNSSDADFAPAAESATSNGPATLGTLACAPGGGPGQTDDEEPTSKITAPKHKSSIPQNESTNFQGTSKDPGGSGVSKVELALRQKRQGGCKWWNGSRFVNGSCRAKRFVEVSGDKGKWSYDVSKRLRPTGRKIKHYTLYSRATDAAGNVEADFIPKVNLVRFEVFKPPITCEPNC